MASTGSRRSSTESDYREVFTAAIHDRLRTGLEAHVQRQKSKRKHHGLPHKASRDADLTRIATNLSKDIGVAHQTLSDVDPRLDPENEAFDFRFWASTFIHLVREDGIGRASVGFSFTSLTVSGTGSSVVVQKTVASPLLALARLPLLFTKPKGQPKVILSSLNGSVRSGEMLLVLGRPGSGCTTFLKAITGQQHGLAQSTDTVITYDGISQAAFIKNFKGRAVYSAENDEHFPHLTVGQTLSFAAIAETPRTRVQGVDRESHAIHMVEVMLRIFGLTHTRNTKVGNDTIRGVSGGERKRVSIAEMALARSSVAAWDNSTRGLDSATALEFVRSLRTLADIPGVTQAVALYQASQSVYDLFDKVLVLYEGRQIFFGLVELARPYFERMGWYCPPRQTTPDFLTSVTNPAERQVRRDFAGAIPTTALEFEKYWHQSGEYAACMAELAQSQMDDQHIGRLQTLRDAHRSAQAKHTRVKSPYLSSVWMQTKFCMRRSTQLLWNDRGATVTLTIGRVILALIIGSIFYGPPDTTASLQSRGSVIFLATLMNALMAVTEISSLFSKRRVVQKQKNYAFYHPFTDAFAAYLVDVPVKFVIATLFNLVFYFLTGLRREASSFFIFLLFNFISLLLMSAIFRSIGALSKQLPMAFAIAGIGILVQVIYTGYTLQTSYMHPWFRWINYINPVAYIFEALLVNEVHGREYPCAPQNIIPPYGGKSNFACAVIGAQPNSRFVLGDDWVSSGYDYSYSHLWRNFGIAIAFMMFFLPLHLIATEFRSTAVGQPQRLIFRNWKAAQSLAEAAQDVEAAGSEKSNQFVAASLDIKEKLSKTTTITEAEAARENVKVAKTLDHSGTLTWQDVTLDISIQGTPRRLLDNVTGWVTPGTLTCLMGVSGAGKTTLLDTLAQRHNTMGKVSGTIMVDGMALKRSFQRKTGYVQQQDLHLSTSTVREALRFSAVLRQPASVSPEEKYSHVEKVIEMLNMVYFCDAIVGQPGEGLNIEQRKLLTIGVELAAKPAILFLDEPTSGLDSQSAWTIVSLLRRLADHGQAILATIHQPSAMMFQQFDSILLLAKGGRTTYFGPLGADCHTLIRYFEAGGARHCDPNENPAEYILEVIGDPAHDWPEVWKSSEAFVATKNTLQSGVHHRVDKPADPDDHLEFAVPFPTQFRRVLVRQFQQYWRTPGYIYAKFQASTMAALFIGFTFFLQNSSITGMQNTLFAIFMLNATFSTVANQIMSRFIPQRALFEIRESPSKMYSWFSFLLANILVEIPYQCLLSVIVWACWYFPVFGYHQDSESKGLMFAFVLQFLLFASTFAQMIIFTMPDMQTAGTVSTILFTLTLQFNGVLQSPTALPGFWIFMWRVSPFTYLIGGWAGTGLANRPVVCAQNELAIFDPPSGQSCGTYLAKYLDGGAPGTLHNPSASVGCEYCPIRNANQFLAGSSVYTSEQYRNLGIMFGYIAFNMLAAMALYYVFRVKRVFRKGGRRGKWKAKKVEKTKKEKTPNDDRDDDHTKRWSKLGFYYHLTLGVFRNVVKSSYTV
ncbi:ABC multidrug transporter [Exophiala viscosa]|uniref:ABC multidrug transporter n=1 Tax=Exophiala viscosa TaxID=2486360 RepID=A0AAN6ICE4_9EURO|nr:ABC multidrug transporter [Exophiala viscosa]KAI1622826.1 ABC multidrug transporter [Exophiala viscosa]